MLTRVWGAQNCVSEIAKSTALTVVPICVVLTFTFARLDITVVRVSVAVARHAPCKRAAIVLVVVTLSTPFTELAFIVVGALALFDIVCGRPGSTQHG